MAKWHWLTAPPTPYRWGFVGRVILKAALLFVAFNLLFALLRPVETLGSISLYNVIVPGRERLPYGENPAQSYNLSLNTLSAMFASHVISVPKPADEYRVLLIGDSATWGWRLENADTLAAAINASDLQTGDGRRVVVYNLGYPIMSLTKDLLLLDEAMRFAPDLVIWLVTLESFPIEKQLFPPLVQHNAPSVRRLIDTYSLALDPQDSRLVEADFWGSTLVGQRRPLADLFRLQLYALPWAATGIDQFIPTDYAPNANDFEDDLLLWEGMTEPQPLTADALAFDVLRAGVVRAGDTPVLIVNEPIFIADGANSDVRYNAFYPRWAYDSYRDRLTEIAAVEGWSLLDVWNLLPQEAFTDSPVHITAEGVKVLAEAITAIVERMLLP